MEQPDNDEAGLGRELYTHTYTHVVIHTVIKWIKGTASPVFSNRKEDSNYCIFACTVCNFNPTSQCTVVLKTHNPFSSLLNAHMLDVCYWEKIVVCLT